MKLLSKATLSIIVAGTIFSSLSCDGIYDDPSEMPTENKENSYAYADATSYTNWVYFYLADNSQQTFDYKDTTDIPAGWTFAMHRYDCKTNGGSAYETSFTSLDDFQAAVESGTFTMPADNEYVADADDSVTVDMSHMMDGYLIYAPSKVNAVLGKWLDVNTSQMPPTYTQSKRVYLVKTKEGNVAAVYFTAFSNPYQYDTKGYISFDYIYPVN